MKSAFLILVAILSISMNTHLMSQSIIKEKFNLNKEMEDGIGYAQAVKVGNTLYISGTAGWGSMNDALTRVYDAIQQTLNAYEADFSNVVKENLYSTQIDSTIKYKDIRLKYYGTDFPAATWVEVKRLYNPGLVVEIEVVAILPEVDKRKAGN